MIKDIVGGVSPLKARQAARGGKYAGKATSSAGRRGGFAKSTGKRGGGGRNVGGYNVQTRFTPGAAWKAPASGGTTIIPSKLPTIPTGPPVVNGEAKPAASASASASASAKAGTDGYWKEWDTKHDYDGLESYKNVWNKNSKGLQDKYTDETDADGKVTKSAYDKFVSAAEAWWDTDSGKKEREKRKKGSYLKHHKEWVPGSSESSGSSSSSSSSASTGN